MTLELFIENELTALVYLRRGNEEYRKKLLPAGFWFNDKDAAHYVGVGTHHEFDPFTNKA